MKKERIEQIFNTLLDDIDKQIKENKAKYFFLRDEKLINLGITQGLGDARNIIIEKKQKTIKLF
ncbi:MAG: hypothetical protein GY849_02505 [Deltaproteobacteria bacterium]|nr:hypothetical protein [Deltaproteobacteria bacterium]